MHCANAVCCERLDLIQQEKSYEALFWCSIRRCCRQSWWLGISTGRWFLPGIAVPDITSGADPARMTCTEGSRAKQVGDFASGAGQDSRQ